MGTSFFATCVGVKKKTRFDWKAFSTSAAATPRAARPPTMASARLVLGFKIAFLLDGGQRPAATHPQRNHFDHDGGQKCPVGHPHEVGLPAHRPESFPARPPEAHAASGRLRTHCARRSRSRITER